MKQLMKLALGALLLIGSIQPAKAGILADLGNLADSTSSKAAEYAMVGIVLYPFLRATVYRELSDFSNQFNFRDKERRQLFVKRVKRHATHALALGLVVYGAKFLIKQGLNAAFAQ